MQRLLRDTIIPKSDQLNADQVIVSPMTITVTGVTISGGDQPVTIHYQNDNGRPYKPCKTMRHILILAWGDEDNGDSWKGRSMTLYCDPTVKWGGQEVGGIRISHLSYIAKPMTFMVTVTRGKKVPYVVNPIILQTQQQPASGTGANNAKVIAQQLKNAAQEGTQSLDAVWSGVPSHEKTQQMIDWYNQQCAAARQVDAQRAQNSDHGFVPPEAEERKAAPQQLDGGPVEQAGIGDI